MGGLLINGRGSDPSANYERFGYITREFLGLKMQNFQDIIFM